MRLFPWTANPDLSSKECSWIPKAALWALFCTALVQLLTKPIPSTSPLTQDVLWKELSQEAAKQVSCTQLQSLQAPWQSTKCGSWENNHGTDTVQGSTGHQKPRQQEHLGPLLALLSQMRYLPPRKCGAEQLHTQCPLLEHGSQPTWSRSWGPQPRHNWSSWW